MKDFGNIMDEATPVKLTGGSRKKELHGCLITFKEVNVGCLLWGILQTINYQNWQIYAQTSMRLIRCMEKMGPDS
ncbi:unnamed protein product [Acanthoscelides obtectus]|uniref:Uncharacterized protein n=1 Tax=Acanthoscelides obtectus TaxID=200917 RepID=A0A9P0KUB6_ACAOB|nr:unnamed protein product [Acanthoscelides obtectus]CAK1631971.1 hypothetical protein AOBTE_LOCUS7266 [Acanthoscelides obtectus]